MYVPVLTSSLHVDLSSLRRPPPSTRLATTTCKSTPHPQKKIKPPSPQTHLFHAHHLLCPIAWKYTVLHPSPAPSPVHSTTVPTHTTRKHAPPHTTHAATRIYFFPARCQHLVLSSFPLPIPCEGDTRARARQLVRSENGLVWLGSLRFGWSSCQALRTYARMHACRHGWRCGV